MYLEYHRAFDDAIVVELAQVFDARHASLVVLWFVHLEAEADVLKDVVYHHVSDPVVVESESGEEVRKAFDVVELAFPRRRETLDCVSCNIRVLPV